MIRYKVLQTPDFTLTLSLEFSIFQNEGKEVDDLGKEGGILL